MATKRDLSGNSPAGDLVGQKDDHLSRVVSIKRSYSVTPDDNNDLANGVTEGLLVSVAGDVKITYQTGVTATVSLAAGGWHPMNVKRVWSTDTTATGIEAGY
jgi:hypothetical protein